MNERKLKWNVDKWGNHEKWLKIYLVRRRGRRQNKKIMEGESSEERWIISKIVWRKGINEGKGLENEKQSIQR